MSKAEDQDLQNKLFSEIYDVQDENMNIVNGLINKADKTQELGGEISEKLKKQKEQLDIVSVELDDLGGQIKRAKKEVTSFMKGIATDKMLIVCICLVICFISLAVALIIICKAGMCRLICDNVLPDPSKCPEIIK